MLNKMTVHVKNEIISVMADALGKQIPLKSRLEKRAGLCAACNTVITRSWKYCPYCGQCIAWNKDYRDEN